MRTSNPRSYNRAAAIAGLVFVGLGIVFLLEALNVFELRARYVWPVVLIAIGAASWPTASGRHDGGPSGGASLGGHAALHPGAELLDPFRRPALVTRHVAILEALEDRRRVLLDILVSPQVERPLHALTVLVPEQRTDVTLEAEARLLFAHPSPWTPSVVGVRDRGAFGS